MRRALAELLALVAPPACVACRASLARADERLCAACARALPWLRGCCPRCGLPRHRAGGCPAAAAAFPRAWAPVAYEGVARDLVRALKFRGALSVADVMAAHMVANLPAPLREPAAIVAVPAAERRRRARGFDPAAVLASAFARRLGRPPPVACLRRHDHAARQVGADRTARRAAGRLDVVVHGAPPEVVLLFDDVHTTGATLDASARALVAGGARLVGAVTYARTL